VHVKVWVKERALGRSLLPVYKDLAWRLLHNGLPINYKFKWLGGLANLCPHGCGGVETALHFGWKCPMAKALWRPFLDAWERAKGLQIQWREVLMPSTLQEQPEMAPKGQKEVPIAWGIIRACVLHTLWHRRLDVIFHPEIPDPDPVTVQRETLNKIEVHWRYTMRARLQTKKKGTETTQWESLRESILETAKRTISHPGTMELPPAADTTPARPEDVERTTRLSESVSASRTI
jgi:hypothetical protein